MLQGLVQCTSRTRRNLWDDTFATPTEWTKIFSSPDFTRFYLPTRDSDFLDRLYLGIKNANAISRLHVLDLSIDSNMTLTMLSLTSLQRFTHLHTFSFGQFATPTLGISLIYSKVAVLLVGIELNPGPPPSTNKMSISSTNAVKTQQLFTDGCVHSIISFHFLTRISRNEWVTNDVYSFTFIPDRHHMSHASNTNTADSTYRRTQIRSTTIIIMTDSDSDSDSEVTKTPPAAPLVGIELNPGPTMSSNNHHQMSIINSMIAINAQHLFTDGLHSILAFLDQNEWLTSSCVNHHWSIACANSSQRDIFMYYTNDEILPHLQVASKSLLRRHLTGMSIGANARKDLVRTKQECITNYTSIITLLPSFTSLNSLSLNSLLLQVDLSPLLSLSQLEYLRLEDHLTSSQSEVLEKYCCYLLQTHELQLALTDEAIESLHELQLFHAQVRTLTLLPHLTRLELYFSLSPLTLEEHHRLVILWMKLSATFSSSITLEEDQMKMIQFPITTRFANGNDRRFSCNELELLWRLFPGERELSLNIDSHFVDRLAVAKKFTRLKSLTLLVPDISGPVSQNPGSGVLDENILNELVQCSSTLESIRFEGTTFASIDHWQRFFNRFASLNSLDFFDTNQPELIDQLSHILECRTQVLSLTLRGTQLPSTSFPLLARFHSLIELRLLDWGESKCFSSGLEKYGLLTRFTELTRLFISTWPHTATSTAISMEMFFYSDLLQILCRCSTTITHLHFSNTHLVFQSSTEWQQLFTHLTSLRRLHFVSTHVPDLLIHLTQSTLCRKKLIQLTLHGTQLLTSTFSLLSQFSTLRSLTLSEASDYDDTSRQPSFRDLSFDATKEALDDSLFIPTLRHLAVRKSEHGAGSFNFNCESRTKQTINYRTKPRISPTFFSSPTATVQKHSV